MACHSIQHVTTPTYLPEHNSVAKQYNCTVMNMVCSMLLDAGLVNWFWAKALNTMVYINNHMPSRSIDNKDPFQLLHRCAPNISKLQPFGCCAYILTPVQMCNKLQDIIRPTPDPEPALNTNQPLPLEPELQCKLVKPSTRKQNKVMMMTEPPCQCWQRC
jgi:hypothetical protein